MTNLSKLKELLKIKDTQGKKLYLISDVLEITNGKLFCHKDYGKVPVNLGYLEDYEVDLLIKKLSQFTDKVDVVA